MTSYTDSIVHFHTRDSNLLKKDKIRTHSIGFGEFSITYKSWSNFACRLTDAQINSRNSCVRVYVLHNISLWCALYALIRVHVSTNVHFPTHQAFSIIRYSRMCYVDDFCILNVLQWVICCRVYSMCNSNKHIHTLKCSKRWLLTVFVASIYDQISQ